MLKLQQPPLPSRIMESLRVAAGDFLDMARFLIIGAFIAGIMQTLITRQTLASSVAGSDLISILFMMFLAIALNLCSEADAFVAASFRNTPISLAAQLAFMVLGPMLDIKLILMYFRLFHKRLIVVLAITVFTLVLLTILAIKALGL